MSSLNSLSILLFGLFLVACDGSKLTVTETNQDGLLSAIDRVDQSSIVDLIELESIEPQSTGSQSTEPEATEPETTEPESAEADRLNIEPAEVVSGTASITDVVLVTGQSNALGSQTSYDPVLDQPVDRFYAYTENGWQPASLRQVWDLGWHPAKGLGDDPHNNFGFHFGKAVAEQRSDRVVGIILVTAPGEGIKHWDSDGFFFRKIRNKILLALNELPHKSGVDGILWHQGETDWSQSGSNDPDLDGVVEDDYYSNKLWGLINSFRAEVWFDADRPFICGETARSPVNARLNSLNRDADAWTACVPGEELPTHDAEQVHFSAQGLRQLGANYADVYLQMTR